MRVLVELGWFFRREWRRYAVAIGALALVALLTMVPPRMVGELVDAIAAKTLVLPDLLAQIGLIVGVALAIYGLRVLWRVYLFGSSLALARELRLQLYAHLDQMPAVFFRHYRTGDLMARCTQDIEAVQMTAGEGVLSMVDGAMTAVVVLGVMTLLISWELTLIALIPWPVMAWLMYQYGNRLHAAFGAAQARFSALNDAVHEAITGIKLVKASGAQALLTEGFRQQVEAATAANLQVARIDAAYDPTITLTMGASFLLSIGFGGYLVFHDQLSLGQLTSFMMYLGYLLWPMFAFGWMLSILERGSASYQRITALLAEPLPPDAGATGVGIDPAVPARVDIEVRLPLFCYEQNPLPVLQGIAFRVPAGATLGILGPVASGKSTLLQLMLRMYETPPGAVKLNGAAIETLPKALLRRHFAWVGQEPLLFSASIADNIALGKPQALRHEIEAAAALAAVDEDIRRFPAGYDSMVGEKGVTLSGGQKQRIAIARALLLNAPVLLLDDALSAVDGETEARILAHLRARKPRATTIIVSHRLTAVECADEILVLEAGRIAQRGTHAVLSQQPGWYRQVYEYQRLERLVDAGC